MVHSQEQAGPGSPRASWLQSTLVTPAGRPASPRGGTGSRCAPSPAALPTAPEGPKALLNGSVGGVGPPHSSSPGTSGALPSPAGQRTHE